MKQHENAKDGPFYEANFAFVFLLAYNHLCVWFY